MRFVVWEPAAENWAVVGNQATDGVECGTGTSRRLRTFSRRLRTFRAAQLQGVPAVWEGDERDERAEEVEEVEDEGGGDGAVTDADGEEVGVESGTGGDGLGLPFLNEKTCQPSHTKLGGGKGLRDDQNNAIVIRFGVESCSCQDAALCLLSFSPTLFDAGDVR